MNVMVRTCRQHVQIIQSYPAAMLVVVATGFLVLWGGHLEHNMLHAIGYLFAVWLGAFVTDVVVNLRPQVVIGFPIKGSAAKEVVVILACTMLGMVPLVLGASGVWRTLHGLYRLPFFPLLLFTFPVVLALLYLFYFRYKPRELGANLHYWYLPLLLHLLVGGITLAVAPERSHWHSQIKAWGLMGLLVTGFLGAALSEEFVRMLLQTRLGSILNNKRLGFVLATFLWAAMHIPAGIRDSRAGSWQVFAFVWVIMPMGFLWGYITHRTKSLFPSIMMHGLNLWGLQNFSG